MSHLARPMQPHDMNKFIAQWEAIPKNEYKSSAMVLSAGCTFSGKQAKIAVRLSPPGKQDIKLDPEPWEPYWEPLFDFYPLFRWAAFTVAVGTEIQIRYHFNAGLSCTVHKKLNKLFEKHSIVNGPMTIWSPGDQLSKSALIMKDDFAIDQDGSSYLLGNWGNLFWAFLSRHELQDPVDIVYQNGSLVVRAGYDREILPECATKVIDENQ